MTVTSRARGGGALMLNAGRRAGATGLWSAQAGRRTTTDTRTARGNRRIELSRSDGRCKVDVPAFPKTVKAASSPSADLSSAPRAGSSGGTEVDVSFAHTR